MGSNENEIQYSDFQRETEIELPIDVIEEARAEFGRSSSHKDLRVYQTAFELALQVHTIAKQFPADERFLLSSQILRSSRSIPANIVEAWRKRRYEQAFVSKLSDTETELCETMFWLDFALALNYVEPELHRSLTAQYESLLNSILGTIKYSSQWTMPKRTATKSSISPSSPKS